MGKRFWLVSIKRSAASMLASALIAIVFYWAVDDDPSGGYFEAALFGMATYLVAGIGLSIVNGIGGLVYLKFLMGDDMQAAVLEALRGSNLPPPNDYQPKTLDYLAVLADDDEADITDRLRAALLCGTFTTMGKTMGFFGGIAFNTAADSAILRYSQEAPRKKSS